MSVTSATLRNGVTQAELTTGLDERTLRAIVWRRPLDAAGQPTGPRPGLSEVAGVEANAVLNDLEMHNIGAQVRINPDALACLLADTNRPTRGIKLITTAEGEVVGFTMPIPHPQSWRGLAPGLRGIGPAPVPFTFTLKWQPITAAQAFFVNAQQTYEDERLGATYRREVLKMKRIDGVEKIDEGIVSVPHLFDRMRLAHEEDPDKPAPSLLLEFRMEGEAPANERPSGLLVSEALAQDEELARLRAEIAELQAKTAKK